MVFYYKGWTIKAIGRKGGKHGDTARTKEHLIDFCIPLLTFFRRLQILHDSGCQHAWSTSGTYPPPKCYLNLDKLCIGAIPTWMKPIEKRQEILIRTFCAITGDSRQKSSLIPRFYCPFSFELPTAPLLWKDRVLILRNSGEYALLAFLQLVASV